MKRGLNIKVSAVVIKIMTSGKPPIVGECSSSSHPDTGGAAAGPMLTCAPRCCHSRKKHRTQSKRSMLTCVTCPLVVLVRLMSLLPCATTLSLKHDANHPPKTWHKSCSRQQSNPKEHFGTWGQFAAWGPSQTSNKMAKNPVVSWTVQFCAKVKESSAAIIVLTWGQRP